VEISFLDCAGETLFETTHVHGIGTFRTVHGTRQTVFQKGHLWLEWWLRDKAQKSTDTGTQQVT